MSYDVIIVGAGHNGLIAACYLAKAGCKVLVLESSDKPGGGSRTEERIPGFHFDMHAVAHNIINMTAIPRELRLAEAGLEYIEMNPFTVSIRADGSRVRFYRSLEATVKSIAEYDQEEANAYARFIEYATPLMRVLLPALRGESSLLNYPGYFLELIRTIRRGGGLFRLMQDLLSPYESILQRRIKSDLVAAPISAYAAHSSAGPQVPGTGLFGMWQAIFHLFGQWHPRGGSVALVNSLVRRLESFGGELRLNAPVTRIETGEGKVRGIALENGERYETARVVTAIHPKIALLELLDPPLAGMAARELAATRTSNAVQALLHVATSRLPPYPNSHTDDFKGLQNFVETVTELRTGFIQAEAGRLPDQLPLYAFTTSAIDATLAPPGCHTVYLACPAAPGRVEGGWENCREAFIEKVLAVMEQRAPGFRDTIIGLEAFTPQEMESLNRWPLGHPMYLDITLDQLGLMRPTRRLSSHRTPIAGLFISGAGTAPVGGIAGTPGKRAAAALLADWKERSKN
ncbi:MAG TPA: NAD(P)/FAD-dependent oxidoreductase [Chloroflexia bacterium]|nr:NAD(P)/FAD-dependent oxidoreductase [Chloroflexia bacterium]